MVKLVLSKIIRFFYRLLSKIIYLCIPFISRILIATRFHSRIINQLNKLRSESHKIDDHRNFISKFLGENKLVALDVGAQGGFFNASIFSEKYNKFFAPIMVEPIASEAEKLVKRAVRAVRSTKTLSYAPSGGCPGGALSRLPLLYADHGSSSHRAATNYLGLRLL